MSNDTFLQVIPSPTILNKELHFLRVNGCTLYIRIRGKQELLLMDIKDLKWLRNELLIQYPLEQNELYILTMER